MQLGTDLTYGLRQGDRLEVFEHSTFREQMMLWMGLRIGVFVIDDLPLYEEMTQVRFTSSQPACSVYAPPRNSSDVYERV
jgi:hypothetical protein